MREKKNCGLGKTFPDCEEDGFTLHLSEEEKGEKLFLAYRYAFGVVNYDMFGPISLLLP